MLWEWENSAAQVFILDLDGTLMPSAEIDNRCFWQAMFGCFSERETLPDLHGFEHVSDSGILEEWCIRELGRSPLAQETRQIKRHFLKLIETAALSEPRHFRPLNGVREWLEAARDHDRVYTGIATGGWEHTARLKLKLAGLDVFDLPLASSDDAMARTQIMHIAAQRTLAVETDERPVFTYVGDGPWDLEASQQLGWRFIGIASGAQAARLKQAGATHIQPDFQK